MTPPWMKAVLYSKLLYFSANEKNDAVAMPGFFDYTFITTILFLVNSILLQ